MMSMPAAVAQQPHRAEIGYDTVGAALEQRHGLPAAPDADNEPEPSGAGCGDAGDRILEHRGPCGTNAETPCSFQKHVRSRLAPQVQAIEIDTIDPRVETCRQPRGSTIAAPASLGQFLAWAVLNALELCQSHWARRQARIAVSEHRAVESR